MTSEFALRSGNLAAGVDPALGGSLTYFRSVGETGGRDWMRALAPGAVRPGDSASFPLVPFSNRIAGARFPYADAERHVSVNWPQGMAIHGYGWNLVWAIAAQEEDRIDMACEIGPPDWPWRATANLTYALSNTGLRMTLAVTNADTSPMPSGLGFHPYFPRPDGIGLRASCARVLETDDDTLPVALNENHPALSALSEGQLPQVGFDNALSGWSGPAVITWPDQRSMRITTEPETSYTIVYVPADRNYFCFEPVTHVPNAHNLQDERLGPTGLIDLAPGETQKFSALFDLLDVE